MQASEIVKSIRDELRNNIDEKTLATSQNFFKGKIRNYGVKVPVTNKIAKKHFSSYDGLTKNEIFEVCEILWQSGYLEESFVACNWSYVVRDKYEPDDFYVFEKWIEKYVNNWASCDTFCNHTVGSLLEMYPDKVKELIKWTYSPNRWMRRSAAVSLIIPARNGKFLNEVFEIADILLTDEDDMVQKGYGWLLKSASMAFQKEIFDYVVSNKAHMPRTALRYAIEKMPEEMRKIAMQKP